MAGNPIQIEYNQSLKPLETLLHGVERAGAFYVHGVAEIPLPKLEVEGVGVLSFPIPPGQTAQLMAQATRAPYGRGEETILDESVRKAWQLSPDKVRVGGKSWAASFDGILGQVIAGLGCEGMAVSAELYKLLLYDTGGFFRAHRDTEKTGGMFGTLVVVLPSAHRGGELLIRHAGREATVDMSGTETSEVSFAAFYADCEHEVRPLTEGNRVCLVYNLLQQQGAQGKGETLLAPHYEKEIAAAAELLEENLSKPATPPKIAWLLEHQYSPEGLSFAGLKSTDAARARVLAQAAARAGCEAHLGIVHIQESGSAEPTYSDHRHRRWGRYQYGERAEIEDESNDEFEVIEVCEGRQYVSQWRNLRDEAVAFEEIPIQPDELLPAGALDDEKPDQQRFMEATGNEGASFHRSYHRAALVIWRHERYAEVLLQAGVTAVLPHLKMRVEACQAKGAPRVARTEAIALARQLVKAWKDASACPVWQSPGRPDKRDGMLHLLIELGDAALLEEFITKVVTRDYNGAENAALVAAAALLKAKKTGQLYAGLLQQHFPVLHEDCMDLLQMLTFKGRFAADKTGQAALCRIAEAAVVKLNEVGKQRHDNQWLDWRQTAKARPLSATLVTNLLDVLGELNALELRRAAVAEFTARPNVFDPVTVLVPALALIHKHDAATARLWNHCGEFLLKRSARPPAAPADWRQDVKLSCSCADCRELQEFVIHPVEQTHHFRVRQDRRQHLHQMIERHGLDLTHVTERVGSPQTLCCTKTRWTYQRRCEEYRKDIAALARLMELASQVSAPATARKNIEAARKLAAEWSPA